LVQLYEGLGLATGAADFQGVSMIVGAYSLHLYCDNGNSEPDCVGPKEISGHDYSDPGFAEFTGQTEAECKKKARRRGWKFTRDGRALCPRHG